MIFIYNIWIKTQNSSRLSYNSLHPIKMKGNTVNVDVIWFTKVQPNNILHIVCLTNWTVSVYFFLFRLKKFSSKHFVWCLSLQLFAGWIFRSQHLYILYVHILTCISSSSTNKRGRGQGGYTPLGRVSEPDLSFI